MESHRIRYPTFTHILQYHYLVTGYNNYWSHIFNFQRTDASAEEQLLQQGYLRHARKKNLIYQLHLQ